MPTHDFHLIPSIPRLSYQSERDSFIMALRAVGQVLGRDFSYPLLKGLSATAFRLVFHPAWQRYTPDALRGFDHSGLALAVLGLCANRLESHPADPDSVACARSAILASLRNGWPVIGLHLMTYEDWGVIAGYRGERLLCHTPHDPSGEPVENRNWPWLVYPISAVGPGLNPMAGMSRSLHVAVNLFETPTLDGLLSGRAAYTAWIEGLRDPRPYQAEPSAPQEYATWASQLLSADRANAEADLPYTSPYIERAHVNHWRTLSLTDARRAAAAYLSEIAPWFDGPAASALAEAARLYAEITRRLEELAPAVPPEWRLATQPWTAANRARQADGLAEILTLEEQAMEQIRNGMK